MEVTLPRLSVDQKKRLDEAVARVSGFKKKGREGMPFQAHIVSKKPLLKGLYDVRGSAMLLDVYNMYMVRFEDLLIPWGPDLHVVLAADLSGKDGVDLGALKSNQGFNNYGIAKGVETDRRRTVLIMSTQFNAVFAYAQL